MKNKGKYDCFFRIYGQQIKEHVINDLFIVNVCLQEWLDDERIFVSKNILQKPKMFNIL